MTQPDQQRPKVLYVDDQPENLLVFQASFERHIDVTTAESAQQGIGLLEREEFPIVISDQRMPVMSGTAFLSLVRERWPDTIRMLVTAYTNFDDVVLAINEGHVSRFIRKPWDAQDVLGSIYSASALYWQIKENNVLRERLLHRERLSAVGQTTSGLVHELANIGTVLCSVDDALMDMWQDTEPPEEVTLLGQVVAKFMVLVDTLRVFAKGGDQLRLDCDQVDAGQLIGNAIQLLRLFPRGRGLQEIRYRPPAGTLHAHLDGRKIEQVLLNLIKNAAEACDEDDGRVEVALRAQGPDVVIEVSDNGPGIPQEAAEKVWNGFYSTKGNQGTGLGLWMCRKIVEAHGGTISYENRAEGGCAFSIVLPQRASG